MNLTIAPLPEGWVGTPDELIQWIVENSTIDTEGSGSAGQPFEGQIGGAKPGTDIGIWFGPNSIERFVNGQYQPITDVPVGAGLPLFGVIAEPENFLLCDGRSLLRDDYPRLFAVIGDAWGSESAGTFNLPKTASRVPIGAGNNGLYEDDTGYEMAGSIRERGVGEYCGTEWHRKESASYPGSPIGIMKSFEGDLPDAGLQFVSVVQPSFGVRWIIRYR